MKFLHGQNSLAPTLLRITIGVIMVSHGLPKVLAIGAFITNVGNMVPFPLNWIFGIGTILVEVGCGALLIAGLKGRLMGLITGIWFLGISAVVHWRALFDVFNLVGNDRQGEFEFPFLIAIAAISIALTGPGKFSVTED